MNLTLNKTNYALPSLSSRCIAVRGTRDIALVNNVAFGTHGHCFYTAHGSEDGVVMRGNIGIDVERGYETPSDKQPAVFLVSTMRSSLSVSVGDLFLNIQSILML